MTRYLLLLAVGMGIGMAGCDQHLEQQRPPKTEVKSESQSVPCVSLPPTITEIPAVRYRYSCGKGYALAIKYDPSTYYSGTVPDAVPAAVAYSYVRGVQKDLIDKDERLVCVVAPTAGRDAKPVPADDPQIIRLEQFANAKGLRWSVNISGEFYCVSLARPGYPYFGQTRCRSFIRSAVSRAIDDWPPPEPWKLEGNPK